MFDNHLFSYSVFFFVVHWHVNLLGVFNTKSILQENSTGSTS